jgi:hypothetical protein
MAYAPSFPNIRRRTAEGKARPPHAGGQAIVGSVASPGVGLSPKSEDQSHAITHAPGTTLQGQIEAEREAVQIPSSQRA